MSWEAIQAFALALTDVVTQIVYVSGYFAAEATAGAAVFAEGAGKALGIIGGAVDGFIKLAGFTGVSQAAVAAFGEALRMTVEAMRQVAANFTVEGVAAAALFAEGAGKVVALVGGGVEGFIKLADFQGVPEAAVAAFGETVRLVIVAFQHIASLFTVEALAAATTFANGVNIVVSTVKTALDAFGTLADFKGVAEGIVSSFTAGLASLLTELQRQVLPASIDVGAQIVAGIIQGVISGQGPLADTLIRVVAEAINGLRASLGIASPSKVMEQMGAFTMQGLARGITNTTPQVVGAMQGASQAITNNDNRQYHVNYTGNAPSSGSAAQDLHLLAMLGS